MSGAQGVCPRCSTPVEPGQEYCVECGLRLETEQNAAPRGGGPPKYGWVWASLAGLVVAAAGAAAAIAVSNHGRAVAQATTSVPAVATTTVPATDTGALPPAPSTTVAVTTVAHVPTVPEDTATATTAKPGLIAWPGKTAYTVVLVSLPAPGGHAAALARAREALKKNLPQVGVLDSADFSSLNPGYYVVFSGAYPSLLQAEVGARNARFSGFASAYPRQIRR